MENDSGPSPQKLLKPQLTSMFERWLLAKRNPLPTNRQEMIDRVTSLLGLCSRSSRSSILSTKTAAKNFLQRQHSTIERQIRNSPSDIKALQLFRSFLGLGESTEGNKGRSSSSSVDEDPFAFNSEEEGKSKTPSKKSPTKAKAGGRRSKTSPESGGHKTRGSGTPKRKSPTRVELEEELEEAKEQAKSTQEEGRTQREEMDEEQVAIESEFPGGAKETAQKKSHEVEKPGKEAKEGGGGASSRKRPREGSPQEEGKMKAARMASEEVLKPSAPIKQEKVCTSFMVPLSLCLMDLDILAYPETAIFPNICRLREERYSFFDPVVIAEERKGRKKETSYILRKYQKSEI